MGYSTPVKESKRARCSVAPTGAARPVYPPGHRRASEVLSDPPWREVERRCRRLASALRQRGIGPGDTVAAMLSRRRSPSEACWSVVPPAQGST